jgi:hypothetical protein
MPRQCLQLGSGPMTDVTICQDTACALLPWSDHACDNSDGQFGGRQPIENEMIQNRGKDRLKNPKGPNKGPKWLL